MRVTMMRCSTDLREIVTTMGGIAITMDRIVVDEATAQPTTNGRCRFYGSAEGGVAMIVCFAAYGDGDNKRGAVAMMHVTTG